MKAEVNGLNEEVVKLLIEKKKTISAAESCTGGLFAALITNVPGSSEVFNESYVTYSNEIKEKNLGVKHDTLSKYGAVSSQTAFEMAKGLYERTGAYVTVGITGIAGPGGGSDEKPVGLVYAGISVDGNIEVLEMHNTGTREEIREKTCINVFKNIKERISVR